MNRGRGRLDPRKPEPSGPKPNRLSRSFRQTQTAAEVESPPSRASGFQTPTRKTSSRAAGGFSGESPHNDSDFQQDIIWDATSPSPRRPGKRGKKHPTGLVDISEIVSRIAPKHGRPEVAEPTLQQWIGDSAAIPCTPDVQGPKPKKKSPRPNGVDDLLKLAKQFDLNMFCRDEEHVADVELLSEDVLDFKIDSPSPAFHPGDGGTTVNAAAGTDVHKHLDQLTDDDLAFLFDGPTQHVSGNLSQASTAQPSQSQVKPVPHGPTSGPSASYEFEDDWDHDDLLSDSLLEMTQNPQKFSAPKLCSTQKPASKVQTPNIPASLDLSAVFKENQTVRQRTTFKLESKPGFCVKGTHRDTWTETKENSGSEPAGTDTRCSWQRPSNSVKSDPPKSHVYHKASAASAKTAPNVQNKPQAPAVHDFLDEDLLDTFFSSDLGWDDPAEDDLLCEMCEDVENQIQLVVGNTSVKQTRSDLQVWNQRAALRPSNRTWDDTNQQSARAGGAGSAGERVTGSLRYTQPKAASGSTSSSACLQGSSRVLSAAPAPRPTAKNQFTFKRPNNPVSTGSHKAVGKCSAAEIELKKQQAMERRRQRLQATQKLRAQT